MNDRHPSTSDVAHADPSGWMIVAVLAKRDLIKFTRQPARIAAAVGTPLLMWMFLSAGFSGGLVLPGGDWGPQISISLFLLPGMLTLAAMFSAIFAAISVIDDRNERWLQSALVSPAPRWSIALGKIAGCSAMAFAQAIVLLPLVWLTSLGEGMSAVEFLAAAAALLLSCIAVSAMGFVLAWGSRSVQSFHAVMNLVFMPMWLLSGAFFPVDRSTTWLCVLARINPLTWQTSLIRDSLVGEPSISDLTLSVVFALAMIAVSVFVVTRPGKP